MLRLIKEKHGYSNETHSVYLENGEYAGYIRKENPRTDGRVYYRVNVCSGIKYNGEYDHEWTGEEYTSLSAARYDFEKAWEKCGSPKPKKRTSTYSAKFLTAEENPDFYPTPSKLIGLMLGGIEKPEGIRTILEPSAGKGDIIEGIHRMTKHIKGYTTYEVFKDADIDCIEKIERSKHETERKVKYCKQTR